jgi:hypothetical protein
MMGKWKISLLSLLTIFFLSACNVGNNEMNEEDGVDPSPVRYNPDTNDDDAILYDTDAKPNGNIQYNNEKNGYDSKTNLGDVPIIYDKDTKQNDDFYNSDTHLNNVQKRYESPTRTRGNQPLEHHENPAKTDLEQEKGNDREFNKNRGAE